MICLLNSHSLNRNAASSPMKALTTFKDIQSVKSPSIKNTNKISLHLDVKETPTATVVTNTPKPSQ